MIDYGRARIDPKYSSINLNNFYVNVNKDNTDHMQNVLNLYGLMHLNLRLPDTERLGTPYFSDILKQLKGKIEEEEKNENTENENTEKNPLCINVNHNRVLKTNIDFLEEDLKQNNLSSLQTLCKFTPSAK